MFLRIFAGDQNDTYFDARGTDYFYFFTFEGNDTIFAGEGGSDIHSGPGNDMLYGSDLADSLAPGDGDDIAFGYGGNDRLHTGRGNDQGHGGSGTDLLTFRYFTIYGDHAVENPYGVYYCLNWNGTYRNMGVFGTDYYTSIENLEGSYGNDVFVGNSVSNVLYGREGNDALHGDYGNDYLYGGRDRDVLNGGYGADQLYGGQPADAITPATLYDGDRDLFYFGAAGHSTVKAPDSIFYFENGIDKIDLRSLDLDSVTLTTQKDRVLVMADSDHNKSLDFMIVVYGKIGLSDIWL